MDIISHGFWAGMAYKAGYRNNSPQNQKKTNFFLFIFWSIFPDVISFGLLFLWFAILVIGSGFNFSVLSNYTRSMDATEPPAPFMPIFQLTSTIYNASHSAIVFLMVFFLFFFFLKTPSWTLLGWLLHILIDIPTHSYQFYPTPFLWPVSGFKVHGFSWGTPWFLILNYSAIILVYFLFWRRKLHSGGN